MAKQGLIQPRARREVLLLLGWYNPPLHQGIARYAREAHWGLDATYQTVGEPPTQWRGDGVIALVTHPRAYEAIKPYRHLPMVDLSLAWVVHTRGAARAEGRKCPRVLYDDPGIARLAVEHLRERGFQNIVFFNRGNYWHEQARLPVFQVAVEAAGARFHEIRFYEHYYFLAPRPGQSLLKAYQWLVRTLAELPKPAGLFVSNDDMALPVLRACDKAGISVPGEVAVLGCGNDPLICDHAPVPLSSVDNDLEGQGYAAARLLDQLMQGQPAPAEPIIISPKGVVTRQSTNVLAVAHPKVARALHFIWEHHQQPIQIADVAAVAGLARRSLTEAFHKHLGRSVGEEIARYRIERAKKLLLETDLKAHEVAKQCGFSNHVHFSQAFNRIVGQRPSRFRRARRAKRKRLSNRPAIHPPTQFCTVRQAETMN